MGKIFCTQCGAENSDDRQFCTSCGAPLRTTRNAESATPHAPEPTRPAAPRAQTPAAPAMPTAPVEEQPQPQSQPEPAATQPQPAKRSGKGKVVGITIAVVAAVAACAIGFFAFANPFASTEPEPEPAPESVETPEPEEVEPEETVDPALEVVSTDTYQLARYFIIDESHIFNDEGVAWAILEDPQSSDDTMLGLINTEGEILYLADPADYGAQKASDVTTSPFVDGLSAIYMPGSSTFTIVDEQGAVRYDNDDESLLMVTPTEDGTFLVLRHDSGFEHDGYVICVLDSDLELHDTGVADDGTLPDMEITTLADGIYAVSASTMQIGRYLDVNKGVIGWLPHIVSGSNEDYLFSGNFAIPIDDLENANGLIEDWSAYEVSNEEIERLASSGPSVTYPEFGDEVSYLKVDPFSGGYSAIYLRGADSKQYVTVIDESGTTQYDPMALPYELSNKNYYTLHTFDDNAKSCNGYIFDYNTDDGSIYTYPTADDARGLIIIAPDGSEKELGDALPGLDDAYFLCSEEIVKLAIGNGYILTNSIDTGDTTYYSTDGTKQLSSFTANYNADGDFVFTDADGKLVTNGTLGSSTSSK